MKGEKGWKTGSRGSERSACVAEKESYDGLDLIASSGCLTGEYLGRGNEDFV